MEQSTGWDGHRADKYLDWQTGNGDIGSSPPDGYYRLWGQSGAPAPSPGWTYQTFAWTFLRNGGPMPTSNFFSAVDTVVHIQPIDGTWHNAGNSYTVNPVVVPEPSVIAALGLAVCSFGLGMLRRRRI